MKNKLKILIFQPALAPYRIDLFNALAKSMEVKVVFLQQNLGGQQLDQKYLSSLLTCEYEYTSSFKIVGRLMSFEVERIISDFQPDVVISMEYSLLTLYISILKLIHRRWGMVVWTDDIFCDQAALCKKLSRKLILKMSDSLIVTIEPVKRWYIRSGIHPDKIGVCPVIHDEKHFRNRLKEAQPIADRYIQQENLSGKRVVLFVGRLAEVKNIDSVIQSFAKISRWFPDAILLIVGDGSEKLHLEKLAIQLGLNARVRFLGRFEDKALLAWYLIGQLFVLTSHSEMYGTVINEALLSGMPVLCSSRAGAADLIREGQNGYVIDPYDISNISTRMSEILRNLNPLEKRIVILRDNLMPIRFDDAVNSFLQAVEYAKGKSR